MGTSVASPPTLKIGLPLATNSRFIDALNRIALALTRWARLTWASDPHDHPLAFNAWFVRFFVDSCELLLRKNVIAQIQNNLSSRL